jgi:glycosyltransferase involved in cell wall biosynthesis
MSTDLPRISIVTSSYQQAEFIGRTIESVIAQDYPNLEHIVVDGLSSDGTVDVLANYPHLSVIREKDRGQADAINKGFRAATGQIFGFLNSDDTLEPGALHRVAAALNPTVGRHIVMGRCRFIDEHDRFLGVEHPSAFESHRRVLEIWRGHWLPQPSTFWTREVWDTCGPLDVDEQLMLDYDLFCRFSKRYAFYQIDAVLANYRMHTQSKTSSMSDAERLGQAISVSRRYWGSPFSLQYWRVLASYARFRLNRRARAVDLMRSGRALYRDGDRTRAAARFISGAALAPDVAIDLALPVVRPIVSTIRRRTFGAGQPTTPQTDAWRSLDRLHADGWAGPTLLLPVLLEAKEASLVLRGSGPPGAPSRPLELEAFLDGRSLGSTLVGGAGADIDITWRLDDVPPGRHQFRIAANTFVVPHDQLGNQDFRPLSYHVVKLDVIGGRLS